MLCYQQDYQLKHEANLQGAGALQRRVAYSSAWGPGRREARRSPLLPMSNPNQNKDSIQNNPEASPESLQLKKKKKKRRGKLSEKWAITAPSDG